MAIAHLLPLYREVAAHAALTRRPLAGQTGGATTAAALSLCPPRPSSPSPMKAARRAPVRRMTCSSTPGIKVQRRRNSLPLRREYHPCYHLFSLFSSRTHTRKAALRSLVEVFQNRFFKMGAQNSRFYCGVLQWWSRLGGFVGFPFFPPFFFVLVNTSVLLARNILLGINEMNIGPEEHFILSFSNHVFTTHCFLIKCETFKLVFFRIYTCDISRKNRADLYHAKWLFKESLEGYLQH